MLLSKNKFGNYGCSESCELLEGVNKILQAYSKILFNLDEI
jgi:hypothetical protein